MNTVKQLYLDRLIFSYTLFPKCPENLQHIIFKEYSWKELQEM